MIATTLSGGIGNQLFKYAAAKAMALRNNTELVLDVNSGFIDDPFHRSYELDNFLITYKTNSLLTYTYKGGGGIKSLSRKCGINIICPTYSFISDRTNNTDVDHRILETGRKNAYLEGYWQSEEYFSDYRDIIRNELTFNFKRSYDLLKEEINIQSEMEYSPVALGIRRYQEVKNIPSACIVDADYYLTAMEIIKSKVSKPPVFYVFSQDLDWVKNSILPYTNSPLVFLANHSTIEDLNLMSRFKYHIISNSSYYWWGAWLADAELVISTRQFVNKKTNLSNWIVL